MADESDRQTIRAEEVEGLRELITEVLREERAVFYARPMVEDMEELRRSPAGAAIRLEEKVEHLGEDVAEIKTELAGIRGEVGELREDLADVRAEMATRQDLHQLDLRVQRLEETTKEDFRRLEETMTSDFRRLEEAQANFVTKEDFRRLEEAQANFVTKEDFQSHEKRLDRLEQEVRSLREELHTQHVNMMRMFFLLLTVMIVLNGDKVIRFLSLLIP